MLMPVIFPLHDAEPDNRAVYELASHGGSIRTYLSGIFHDAEAQRVPKALVEYFQVGNVLISTLLS